MRISLKAMHYFLLAADCKSITKAADKLHIVPSAVSSAIDQVENEFGLTLLKRYPSRGIQPTTTGLILVEKIRHLLEEYNNLLAEGSDLRSALTGTLRIGYYAPIAPAFMPEITESLIKDNATVDIKFVECDNESVQTGLLNGEFDAILFVAENVRAGIEYETLLEVPAFILTAGDQPLAQCQTIKLSELEDQPLVLLDRPAASEYYRSLIEQSGINPNIVATATSTEMVRSLVSSGMGSAILNMCPLVDVSYAGKKLVAIPIVPAVKPLNLVLGYIPKNPRRLVLAFVEACRAFFDSDTALQLIVRVNKDDSI